MRAATPASTAALPFAWIREILRWRLYLPGVRDAGFLDRLLDHNRHGDVCLATDRIICAVNGDDEPTGCLVWRPCALIHELHVPDGLAQRSVADQLYREAVSLDIGRRHFIRQSLFMVDSSNASMLRYARDVGAVEQSGTIFALRLPNESNGQVRQRVEAG